MRTNTYRKDTEIDYALAKQIMEELGKKIYIKLIYDIQIHQ